MEGDSVEKRHLFWKKLIKILKKPEKFVRVFLSALDDFEFIWSPLYSLEKREGESEDPFLPIFVCSAVAIRRRRNEN